MNLELGRTWSRKLEGRINKFEFQVGVLDDGPHFEPVETKRFGEPDLKTYAGGPARRQTRQMSELTTGQILVENMKRLNINILQAPFKDQSSDILKFTDAFLKLCLQRPGINIKRVENLLQAVVRNPILKQAYGQNSSVTADNKGFDRHLIDTSQMFKAIIARATRRG